MSLIDLVYLIKEKTMGIFDWLFGKKETSSNPKKKTKSDDNNSELSNSSNKDFGTNLKQSDYTIPIELLEKIDDLLYLENKLYSGFVTIETYDNGGPKKIMEIKKGIKEGRLKEYYENGELMMEGSFSEGKKEGFWKVYNENGELMMEESLKLSDKIMNYPEDDNIDESNVELEETLHEGTENIESEYDDELNRILQMNPNSSCIVYHELTETWSNCYFQYKDNSKNSDGKVFEKFEEKYNECGSGDLGLDNESVFNPQQKVHHESSLNTVYKSEITSDTLIGKLQEKIKDYLSKFPNGNFEELVDYDSDSFESLKHPDFVEGLPCDDDIRTIDSPDDSLLWFSYYELDYEFGDFRIEEIDLNELKNNQYKSYYENGQLKYEWSYNKSGKKEGLIKVYFENGQIQLEGNCKNGKLEGLTKYYFKNGQLKSQGHYLDNKKVDNWKVFNEKGQIESQGNYKDGEKDGHWKLINPNGSISEGIYTNNQMDGVWKNYDENGNLESTTDLTLDD